MAVIFKMTSICSICLDPVMELKLTYSQECPVCAQCSADLGQSKMLCFHDITYSFAPIQDEKLVINDKQVRDLLKCLQRTEASATTLLSNLSLKIKQLETYVLTETKRVLSDTVYSETRTKQLIDEFVLKQTAVIKSLKLSADQISMQLATIKTAIFRYSVMTKSTWYNFYHKFDLTLPGYSVAYYGIRQFYHFLSADKTDEHQVGFVAQIKTTEAQRVDGVFIRRSEFHGSEFIQMSQVKAGATEGIKQSVDLKRDFVLSQYLIENARITEYNVFYLKNESYYKQSKGSELTQYHTIIPGDFTPIEEVI